MMVSWYPRGLVTSDFKCMVHDILKMFFCFKGKQLVLNFLSVMSYQNYKYDSPITASTAARSNQCCMVEIAITREQVRDTMQC